MDTFKKMLNPNDDDDSEDGSTALLSDLLAATGGYFKMQQTGDILSCAKALRKIPIKSRTEDDVRWLEDFVQNIGKVFMAEDEMKNIVSKRKNAILQQQLAEQQKLQGGVAPEAPQASTSHKNDQFVQQQNPLNLEHDASIFTASSPSQPNYLRAIEPPPLPPPNRPLPIPTIKLNEFVLKPERFEGKRDQARLWLEDYEVAAIANSWSPEIKTKYFSKFLSGSARNWYFRDCATKN